jgi:hypothetical protein
MRKQAVITGAVLFLMIPCTPAAAQLVFSVCHETCPDPFRDGVGAAVCQARISLCESKLTAYNGYMAQLGAGVTTYQLPALYREMLQPFYSGNIANWRFGFADRQPPNNATTDCNVTYFNNIAFVTKLQQGLVDSSWDWLFHELRHFSQCSILGGRDAYAKMWFGHLEIAFIQSNDLATLHDRMWMENDAETYSTSMISKTSAIRDVHNHLVRPMVPSILGPGGNALPDQSTFALGSYRLSAKVEGGSDPIARQWSIKVPGSAYFLRPASGVIENGNTFQFTPTATGEYTVAVLVSQPNSRLAQKTRKVVINVVEGRKTISNSPRR